MRTAAVLLSVPAIILSAGTATALRGDPSVVCENGRHTLSVSGHYYEQYDGPIDGIVFKREILGVCLEPEYVPETPVPFNPQQISEGYYYYEVSVAIDALTPNFAFRYTPHIVRPDDTLVPMTYSCDNDGRNYAIANCGGAPLSRGRLELEEVRGWGPRVKLVLCSTSCWSEPIWLRLSEADAASQEPIEELLGEIVDVYGSRTWCAMIGGDAYSATLIERAPEGTCTSLPVHEENWGALKALYD